MVAGTAARALCGPMGATPLKSPAPICGFGVVAKCESPELVFTFKPKLVCVPAVGTWPRGPPVPVPAPYDVDTRSAPNGGSAYMERALKGTDPEGLSGLGFVRCVYCMFCQSNESNRLVPI